jgi:putative hydrolase of the HAD superfamily
MSDAQRQHLLFDADDTLWENNIYFEQAFDDFVAFLNHEHLSTSEIQTIMDEVQISLRGSHGYGARAFAHGLRETFRRIHGVSEDDPDLATVEQLGLRILDQQFELLPGVAETLTALRPHHDLILITKGHNAEQQAKVERSGISDWFDAVLISDEKDESTYRDAVATLDLDPALTWMIGNSPKSDINPALRAGINAIFIPHPRTWHLEHEVVTQPVDAPGRLLELGHFVELTTIFRAD